MQHTAIHCNTLQHTAAHCSTLQNTARRFTDVAPCLPLNLPPYSPHLPPSFPSTARSLRYGEHLGTFSCARPSCVHARVCLNQHACMHVGMSVCQSICFLIDMNTGPYIHIYPHIHTCMHAYIGVSGEFTVVKFRAMMQGELFRYARRGLTNIISERCPVLQICNWHFVSFCK